MIGASDLLTNPIHMLVFTVLCADVLLMIFFVRVKFECSLVSHTSLVYFCISYSNVPYRGVLFPGFGYPPRPAVHL